MGASGRWYGSGLCNARIAPALGWQKLIYHLARRGDSSVLDLPFCLKPDQSALETWWQRSALQRTQAVACNRSVLACLDKIISWPPWKIMLVVLLALEGRWTTLVVCKQPISVSSGGAAGGAWWLCGAPSRACGAAGPRSCSVCPAYLRPAWVPPVFPLETG